MRTQYLRWISGMILMLFADAISAQIFDPGPTIPPGEAPGVDPNGDPVTLSESSPLTLFTVGLTIAVVGLVLMRRK